MFTGIPHTEVESVWGEIVGLIVKACESCNGRYLATDVKKLLKDRKWQLWVYRESDIQAICVTEILLYPRKKYCRIVMGIGRDRTAWQDHRKTIEEWARSQGCDGIESIARIGWKRIFTDWQHTHEYLERTL